MKKLDLNERVEIRVCDEYSLFSEKLFTTKYNLLTEALPILEKILKKLYKKQVVDEYIFYLKSIIKEEK